MTIAYKHGVCFGACIRNVEIIMYVHDTENTQYKKAEENIFRTVPTKHRGV